MMSTSWSAGNSGRARVVSVVAHRPSFDREALGACYATLREKSRSFALASSLLPRGRRDAVVVVYAFCRRVDDAVDGALPAEQPHRLAELERGLDEVYDFRRTPSDSLLAAFQQVVLAFGLPRYYPSQLLAGMRMDVEGRRYRTLNELLEYCYCVAGTVGLMMAHVLGSREPGALAHAAHLGMAMQLTNVCRDVREDWLLGRSYIPVELLAQEQGAGRALTPRGLAALEAQREPLREGVRSLLREASRLYSSGARGIRSLGWRAAWSVAAAGLVYREIGVRLARQGHDVMAARSVVPGWRKLLLVLWAALLVLASAPARLLRARGEARELPLLTFDELSEVGGGTRPGVHAQPAEAESSRSPSQGRASGQAAGSVKGER